MSIRPRRLPAGWYPADRTQTIREIEGYLRTAEGVSVQAGEQATAGIAPHAGWSFSGGVACQVIRRLPHDAQTVVVVGGHLGPQDEVLAAPEEGYQTPLGVLPADLELLELLRSQIEIGEDRRFDNTVEIQLPFVRHFLPQVRALALRAPPSQSALRLAEALAEAAGRLSRRVTVLGSTDLTHYGSNYGFSPRGGGPEAVRWVKEVNDRRLIDSLLTLRLEEALDRGLNEHSACSVGAAVCAARFAWHNGAAGGRLLEYRTSYDVYPAESFVGYAGIIYPGSA
jgi:AmmeMemoRadiSam system protein B